MRTFAFPLLCAGLALGLAACTPTLPGSNGQPADAFTVEEAADFSKLIERELAARGAYVALVFRTGRPRENMPEGIRYTHGAFWVYTPVETADGETLYGYAVYNLYHEAEETRRSFLHQDWPLDFTRGDVVGEVGVIVPSPEMQRRILDVMASDDYDALHQSEYSLVSNPADGRFQNCTEFMLDVIAAAAWETADRDRLKVNLGEYFNPAEIELGFFQRLLGPMFDPRIRLEDQNGAIATSTFAGIAEFMETYELDQEVFELTSPYAAAGDAS